MKIMFLSRSLDRGGAQRQMSLLAGGLAARGHEVTVAVFYRDGPFRTQLEAAGVSVIDLHKRNRWDVLGFSRRLLRCVRELEPAVLHAYLPVPNILAALLGMIVRGPAIVWGVRSANMTLAEFDRLSGFAYRVEAALARLPDLIICNSGAGREQALRRGFPAEKLVTVVNGVDTGTFCFDESRRNRQRQQWEVSDQTPVIGVVGRLDPMKDHKNFLRAAARVLEECPDVQFACIGDGVDRIAQLPEAEPIRHRLILESGADDMVGVYSALDVACSSSSGEGFSNVVAEAMACERVCVVTDVGDSAQIVGDTGFCVRPENAEALAQGLLSALRVDPLALGAASRERIVEQFDEAALVQASEKLLARIVSHH